MAKWLVSIYLGIDGMDKMQDPTINYVSREVFDRTKIGSLIRISAGLRKVKKIKMSPFGKPWHKLLTCEVINE